MILNLIPKERIGVRGPNYKITYKKRHIVLGDSIEALQSVLQLCKWDYQVTLLATEKLETTLHVDYKNQASFLIVNAANYHYDSKLDAMISTTDGQGALFFDHIWFCGNLD